MSTCRVHASGTRHLEIGSNASVICALRRTLPEGVAWHRTHCAAFRPMLCPLCTGAGARCARG